MMRALPRVLPAAVLAVAFNVMGGVASADPIWCEEDPVYSFGGRTVDVTTGFESTYLDAISGPILFELELPTNAPPAVALGVAVRVPQQVRISYTLPAWAGQGEIAAIAYVTVSAKADFDTRTRLTGTTDIVAIVAGRSNQRTVIPLHFTIGS